MAEVTRSNLFYPNKIARIYLETLEEVMGKKGINALLHLAKLSHLIDNYPPNNLEKAFPFEDFAALNQALEDMYGPKGGRGLALRAARASFDKGLKEFGAIVGVADAAFKLLPIKMRLSIGLKAMADVFNRFSDQVTRVEEKEDHFVYTIEVCPVCYGRHSDRPVCYAALGLLMEGLKWAIGKEFDVRETKCIAAGDPVCEFIIPKQPKEE